MLPKQRAEQGRRGRRRPTGFGEVRRVRRHPSRGSPWAARNQWNDAGSPGTGPAEFGRGNSARSSSSIRAGSAAGRVRSRGASDHNHRAVEPTRPAARRPGVPVTDRDGQARAGERVCPLRSSARSPGRSPRCGERYCSSRPALATSPAIAFAPSFSSRIRRHARDPLGSAPAPRAERKRTRRPRGTPEDPGGGNDASTREPLSPWSPRHPCSRSHGMVRRGRARERPLGAREAASANLARGGLCVPDTRSPAVKGRRAENHAPAGVAVAPPEATERSVGEVPDRRAGGTTVARVSGRASDDRPGNGRPNGNRCGGGPRGACNPSHSPGSGYPRSPEARGAAPPPGRHDRNDPRDRLRPVHARTRNRRPADRRPRIASRRSEGLSRPGIRCGAPVRSARALGAAPPAARHKAPTTVDRTVREKRVRIPGNEFRLRVKPRRCARTERSLVADEPSGSDGHDRAPRSRSSRRRLDGTGTTELFAEAVARLRERTGRALGSRCRANAGGCSRDRRRARAGRLARGDSRSRRRGPTRRRNRSADGRILETAVVTSKRYRQSGPSRRGRSSCAEAARALLGSAAVRGPPRADRVPPTNVWVEAERGPAASRAAVASRGLGRRGPAASLAPCAAPHPLAERFPLPPPDAARPVDQAPAGRAARAGCQRRRRSAFATTETLEKAMAVPASAGESRPNAASGSPKRL